MRSRIVIEEAPQMGEFGKEWTWNFLERGAEVGEDVGREEPNWDEEEGKSE
jgi:hypothetical protein